MLPPTVTSTRRLHLWLAIGVMAFGIYASLLPFAFEAKPLPAAWHTFLTAMLRPPAERISRTNFLANLLLFVPVGYGLMGARLVGGVAGTRALVTALIIFPISISVSALAEFLQVFAPERIPALSDVVAQTIGCAMGIVIWTIAGERLTTWIRETADRNRSDRLTRVLAAYAVVWLLVNLAPFDISVDVGELGRRLRTGMINIVPFRSPLPPTRQAWDALASAISAAPLGALALVGWTGAKRRGATLAWILGTIAVAMLEAGQVFIRSHAADVTDILFGSLGVAAGVVLGQRRVGRTQSTIQFSTLAPRGAVALVLAWIAILCAYHWQPFDFGIDLPLIQEKLGRVSLIPFAGYRTGSDLNALNNALAKVAISMPLGVLAALALARWTASAGVRATTWIVMSAGIFSAIETGQLFIPSRTPDPTDVLIGVAASVAGLWLGDWLRGR